MPKRPTAPMKEVKFYPCPNCGQDPPCGWNLAVAMHMCPYCFHCIEPGSGRDLGRGPGYGKVAEVYSIERQRLAEGFGNIGETLHNIKQRESP